MSRRPQRNPRRGILRAAAAVVVLVILLLLAILITASLTAPPATAPTVPATPGPSTVAPLPSPTSAARSKRAKPSPTPTHKKLATGVSSPSSTSAGIALDDQNRAAPPPTPVPPLNAAFSADGRVAAYFVQTGTAYSRNPLFIRHLDRLHGVRMGSGDALLRPVWSPDGRYLLYVRVDKIRTFPLARWTLLRLDTATRRTQVLDRQDALALEPLGWSRGRILYLVVGATDTSLYSFEQGRRSFLAIMMPQAVTSALLSPDGRYVAFAAPTNCSPCTLDLYDLDDDTVDGGPGGLLNETGMTWSVDGSQLVVDLRGRLAALDPASLATRWYAIPPGLPNLSLHPLRARASSHTITVRDMVTGRTYRSTA